MVNQKEESDKGEALLTADAPGLLTGLSPVPRVATGISGRHHLAEDPRGGNYSL